MWTSGKYLVRNILHSNKPFQKKPKNPITQLSNDDPSNQLSNTNVYKASQFISSISNLFFVDRKTMMKIHFNVAEILNDWLWLLLQLFSSWKVFSTRRNEFNKLHLRNIFVFYGFEMFSCCGFHFYIIIEAIVRRWNI